MEKYDYCEALRDDILLYIRENVNFLDFYSVQKLAEHLINSFTCRSMATGEGVGSYFCNSVKAKECVFDNLNLLNAAIKESGVSGNYLLEKGAEAADVLIRQYLFEKSVYDAIDEIEKEFDLAHEIKDLTMEDTVQLDYVGNDDFGRPMYHMCCTNLCLIDISGARDIHPDLHWSSQMYDPDNLPYTGEPESAYEIPEGTIVEVFSSKGLDIPEKMRAFGICSKSSLSDIKCVVDKMRNTHNEGTKTHHLRR